MRKKIFFTTFVLTMALMLLAAPMEASVHTVRPGESLWLISQAYGTTVSELASLNGIRNTSYIEAGQVINIPGKYRVRPEDTMWLIARRHNISLERLIAANNLSNPHYVEVGQVINIPGSSSSTAAPTISRSTPRYSAWELDLFARLVHSEAAGESYQGQVAVAASVLNRIRDSRYPSTLSGVINQVVSGYYQYSPVLDGRINLPANNTARRAVQEALAGSDPSRGATGFYNPAKTSNQWVRSQPVTTVIGNHVFFR